MTATVTKTSLHPHQHETLGRLFEGVHHDPHMLLGLHNTPEDGKVIRLWRPGAEECHFELNGKTVSAKRIHEAGLFELHVPDATTAHDYRVYHLSGLLAYDPYAFTQTFGELDAHLFSQGVHYELYQCMGGRVCEHQGVKGVKFAVWAPSARRVSLVSDFNHFDGRVNPMRSMGNCGVWELFVPGLVEGEKYKFEIITGGGELKVKSDPYSLYNEVRPSTASIVADVESYPWGDTDWMRQRRENAAQPKPINTYEVHLGSWKRENGGFKNYRDLAHDLAGYCKEMGFTHVELMPISEHPFDESWGYQVTGYYAVTSRYGSPEDFQYFVDHLHQNGIGVIIDWVPGHFPEDDFALARFDGTALYEHHDPKEGFHPHWNTLIFNFGRKEVANFLIANALFWLDVMHVDGLRVDAVASMLYRDYGREEGEWVPNQFGGKENIEAIEFIRHFNSIVHQRFPGAMTIAEESTSFGGVCCPVEYNGLGFDYKWNMGWMNDTLRYISKDSLFRQYHHNDLTFGLLYAFSEKFTLVLSHDEVVHGKRSLLDKMPGDLWQKFANLRLLLSYMICQPGKKLLFMGGEFGQWQEWQCGSEIDWGLLEYDTHRGVQSMVKEANHLYKNHKAFWEKDGDWQTFEWVDFSDTQNSVISYLRRGSEETLFCIHNFTPNCHDHYLVNLKNVREIKEIFNSDATEYGGSGKAFLPTEILHDQTGYPYAVKIVLPPLATAVFRVTFH